MSLVLSPLQQSWLQELQVAPPFLRPYRAAQVVERSRPAAVVVPTVVPAALTAPTAPVVAPFMPMSLVELKAYVEQCQTCARHEHRAQTVFGVGQTHQPDWFVVSKAPSSHEELAGLPMQAKSGELFQAQMQSIGISIEQQLYLSQLLKCSSASTKDINAELDACQAILLRQIELVRPKRLLLLGSNAAAFFLGTKQNFEALRGRVHSWESPQGHKLPVVVTYHPSSLLLHPQFKAQAWQDLQLLVALT